MRSIEFCQFVQSFIQRQKLRRARLRHQRRFARERFIERDLLRFAAVFDVLPPPRMVDQNVAHHLRGHREKVCAILPVNILLAREAKISFVNQRGGLQRVAIALALT